MSTSALPLRFLDYTVLGPGGDVLGKVLIDLRESYPRRRLVVEHGHWLLRRSIVVPHAHIVSVDTGRRTLRLDLNRAQLRQMPAW